MNRNYGRLKIQQQSDDGELPLVFGLSDGGEIRIDSEQVKVQSKSLLGGNDLSEPLGNYRGVRWKRLAIHDERPSGRAKTRYRHIIELVHSSPEKTIPLFVEETGRANAKDTLALVRKAFSTANPTDEERAELEAEAGKLGQQAQANNPRAHWEAFAALLDLPAIDARDGMEEVRDAADLDKSLKESIDGGKVDFDSELGPPPKQLDIRNAGEVNASSSGELDVAIQTSAMPKVVLLAFYGIGAVLLIAGIFTLSFGSIFGGLLFGGAAWGIRWFEQNNPSHLKITPDEIRYKDPKSSARNFTVPINAIEGNQIRERDTDSIDAKTTLKLSGKELLISTDEGEYPAGAGLTDESLAWLRNYMLSRIAKG